MVVTRGRGRGQWRVAWMHAQRHVGVPWRHWVGHGRRGGGPRNKEGGMWWVWACAATPGLLGSRVWLGHHCHVEGEKR